MKRFFRILSALIAAVMLAGMCAASGVFAASGVSEAEKSVVIIQSDYGQGSGFMVGKVGEDPKYVITNSHVVSERGVAANEVLVYFSVAANKFMQAEIIAVDINKDLCVLELPEATNERKAIPLCESKNVEKGDDVYALGYPAYARGEKLFNALDIDDIVSTKGNISQKTRINVTGAIGVNSYLTDTTIDHGTSGGPMINDKGEAIGVNTYKLSVTETNDQGDESQYAVGGYATIIDELIPILNSNNVPYTLSNDTPEANAETDDDSVPAEAHRSESSNTTVIIIIAAAVIAAAAVVVVIALRKKNGRTPVQSVQSAPSSPVKAVITGTKGVMAGRSFNVGGELVFGRNGQKCGVVFPVDTKGISGVHCQIRQSNGGYEIVDLGSSNGTFLGSGQKLIPNVPVFLPSGTYFYLGSADQLFQITY